MATFPVLPPELRDEIFQIAAWQSTETANMLRQVSKGVAYRIEPILYEIVTLDGLKFTARKFIPVLTTEDPSEVAALFRQYGRHVHYLCLDAEKTTAISFIKLCPSLRNLIHPASCSIEMLDTIQQNLPHLEQLSGRFGECRASLDALKPAYNHLTHFDLVGAYSWDPTLSTFLPRLPSLTHLAIDDVGLADEVVSGALRDCQKLRALVLVSEYFHRSGPVEIRSDSSEPEDKRVVQVSVAPLDNWLAGVTGEQDMWKLADEIISQRRSAV